MKPRLARNALFLSVVFLSVAGTAHAQDQIETAAGWALSGGTGDYGEPAFAMMRTVGPVTIRWSRTADGGRATVISSTCAMAGWSSESDLTVEEATPQPLTEQARTYVMRALADLVGDCPNEKPDTVAAFAGFDEAAAMLERRAQPSGQGR